MGCCSLSGRRAGSAGTGQDEVELLKTDRTRMWSNSEGQSEASLHPLHPLQSSASSAILAETEDTEELWGRTREELASLLITQPISGWEGMNIHSLGEIIWSSLVFLRSYCMEEMCERYIVLSSSHLLILSVDRSKKALVYEGLLPLAGMRLREIAGAISHTFEISGSMIESRLICCQSSADFDTWVQHLRHQIERANAHRPASPNNNISFLVSPCRRDVKTMR
ncbi:ARHG7 factor, partial [Ardeotis kori]|nr:ARHG7 factor [Ardeotis kori]